MLMYILLVVHNNIMVLIPNKELLNPYFLFYFFNTFKLADIINTGAVPTISAETVRSIQIPELDIEEQKNIVKEIDSIVITMKKQEQIRKFTSIMCCVNICQARRF